jgi:PLP dependent protein
VSLARAPGPANDTAERIADVTGRIAAAALRAGRKPSDVALIAVTKTFSVDVCAQALEEGIENLGENRAQELKAKVKLLDDRARWHFIGHLQTNKVRAVVGIAALIHSVDRLDVAGAIDECAHGLKIVQDVLLQVNVARDYSKWGVGPADLGELARRVDAMEHVRVAGLMTMPPYPDDPEDSRPFYKKLAQLKEQLSDEIPSALHLSMGMTRDFEVAVEEGATYVRVGEALFGTRNST